VREIDDKKRLTEGRAGAIVMRNKQGTSAEVMVVSVLHLSLQRPVLKTFEKVKVSTRKLLPFNGTSTCDAKDLDSKWRVFLSKFGVRKNSRGKRIRCRRKTTICHAAGRSKSQAPKVVTPTKKVVKSPGKCFSESKLPQGQYRLTKYNTKTLEVVFKCADDMKKDDAVFLAAMSTHRLSPCDWKPCGKPHIVDANGTEYSGKPQCMSRVAFPLKVALKMTKAS